MNLQVLLGRPAAHTLAAIGSGGKTTLLRGLAEELAAGGASVVLATTTHFLPFEGVETLMSPTVEEAAEAARRLGVVCVASPAAGGAKLAAPEGGVERYAEAADYLLIEADGSKRLPLKAHEAWEPVVPAGARRVLVVGASGFGKKVSDVVHRPGIFCGLAGCSEDDAAAPELVARAAAAEGLADAVVVNQVEDASSRADAAAFARELARLGCAVPVYAGSIRAHDLSPL